MNDDKKQEAQDFLSQITQQYEQRDKKEDLETSFNSFYNLLRNNHVSAHIVQAFNGLRLKVAEALKRASDFVATDEVIEKTTKTALMLNAFGDNINAFTTDSNDLRPELIALSLGREYRFWNQTELTVAEHCVTMANYMEQVYPDRPEFAKWAMFHEIGEVVLGDTPTPVKDIVPGIRKNENILLANFARDNDMSLQMPFEVHLLDKQMMVAEARVLMPREEHWLKYSHNTGLKMIGKPMELLDTSMIRQKPLVPDDSIQNFAKKWIDLGLPNSHSLTLMAQGKINEAIEHTRNEILQNEQNQPEQKNNTTRKHR